MIYLIITTCIRNRFGIQDDNERRERYINAISETLKHVPPTIQPIIVENNGNRITFLNMLGCEVFYTNNNFIKTRNKGIKELKDVLDCIYKYNINDTDFIVKMTGRYILDDDSEFMNIIKNIHNTKYDCVIRYGTHLKYKINHCEEVITGLIGMSCLYVKQIEKPTEHENVELKWGTVTNLIDDKKIYIVNTLGINMCPLGINICPLTGRDTCPPSTNYFKV